MALNSSIAIAISILPDGVLQVSTTRTITDDSDGSQMIGQKRAIFTPDMDPTTLPANPRLRRVAAAVWDQATIDAYKAAHPAILA